MLCRVSRKRTQAPNMRFSNGSSVGEIESEAAAKSLTRCFSTGARTEAANCDGAEGQRKQSTVSNNLVDESESVGVHRNYLATRLDAMGLDILHTLAEMRVQLVSVGGVQCGGWQLERHIGD